MRGRKIMENAQAFEMQSSGASFINWSQLRSSFFHIYVGTV